MSVVEHDLLAEVDQLLARLNKLHSSPAVALQVMDLTRDPDFDIAEVLRCLESDPALTAAVLRLVNSSYYGLGQRINDIQHAMVYLGRRSLRLAVLGFGLVKAMTEGSPKAFHHRYWRRSLTMAVAARKLAARSETCQVDGNMAFTAGLLADLGMVALAQLETQRYLQINEEQDHVRAQLHMEREKFGFTHVEVGARLLSKWQLPEELVTAVAHHHTCPIEAAPLDQILKGANLLAEVLWTAESPHMKLLLPLLSIRHHLNVDDLISLAGECKQSVNESVDIFQLRLEGEIDIDAVETQARMLYELAALESAAHMDSVDARTEGPATTMLADEQSSSRRSEDS